MVPVRTLEPQDLAAWRPLWDAYLVFYGVRLDEATTASTFARLTSGAMHGALALDEDGGALGLVHWQTHPTTWSVADSCYLEDLFVVEGARGAGAGGALVEHVRAWSAARGLADVHWLTAETNATAQRLYDRIARRTGMIQFEIELGT